MQLSTRIMPRYPAPSQRLRVLPGATAVRGGGSFISWDALSVSGTKPISWNSVDIIFLKLTCGIIIGLSKK